MTIAERIIEDQKKSLRKLHNQRFLTNTMEYRLTYEWGIAEYISIQGRRRGVGDFKYVNGFNAYTMNGAEALERAKMIIGVKD